MSPQSLVALGARAVTRYSTHAVILFKDGSRTTVDLVTADAVSRLLAERRARSRPPDLSRQHTV